VTAGGADPRTPDVANLQRIALKIFLDDESVLEPSDVIPVFHRWIQTQAVDGLLIDVADYSHMATGPCVLLVAHEGHYVLDRAGGRLGLQYARRQPLDGALPDRLVALGRILLRAGQLLETDTSLPGPVRFRGHEIECIANDRLLAPNRAETLTAFRPALDGFLTTLSAGASWTLTREADPRARFGVLAHTPGAATLDTIAARLRQRHASDHPDDGRRSSAPPGRAARAEASAPVSPAPAGSGSE